MHFKTAHTKEITKSMKNNSYSVLNLIVILVLLTSCTSTKKMVYFQDVENQPVEEAIVTYEPKIQVGDLLTINVSGLDPVAAATFNIYESNGYGNPKSIPYLVSNEETIHFPVLGAISIKGLTTLELTHYLEANLKEYLVKPIVNIRLINFKITVMGDVKSPGAYTIPNERITVVEALGLAGDLTIQGKRKNIVLIREVDGKRTFVNLDLTSKKLFSSPYYYLAQNDVLYVEPNKAKINSSSVGANAGIILSSISTLISLIAILTR